MNTQREDGGIEHVVSQAVRALGEQLEVQAELVKAELAQDGLALARDLAPLLIGGAILAGAYLLGCVAGALFLAIWIGPAAGFFILCLLNLLLGGFTLRWSLARFRVRRVPTPPLEVPDDT